MDNDKMKNRGLLLANRRFIDDILGREGATKRSFAVEVGSSDKWACIKIHT